MIRPVFLCLLFVQTLHFQGYAQSKPLPPEIDSLSLLRKKFDLGVQAGPSVNMLFGNAFIRKYDVPAANFGAGMFFRYNLKNVFTIGTGLYFDRKGAHSTATHDEQGNEEYVFQDKRSFGYLEVPLTLRAVFGKKIQYFAEAGIFAGGLIQQSDLFLEPYGLRYGEEHINSYKRIDYGLIAGGGTRFLLRDGDSFGVEYRADVGLNDISRDYSFSGGSTHTFSGTFFVTYTNHYGKRKPKTKVPPPLPDSAPE